MSTINVFETILLLEATQLTEQTLVIEQNIEHLRPLIEEREVRFNDHGNRLALESTMSRDDLIGMLSNQLKYCQQMIEMSLDMKLRVEADARKHIGDVRIRAQVLNDLLEATRVYAKTADEHMALLARSSFTTTQMLKAIGA